MVTDEELSVEGFTDISSETGELPRRTRELPRRTREVPRRSRYQTWIIFCHHYFECSHFFLIENHFQDLEKNLMHPYSRIEMSNIESKIIYKKKSINSKNVKKNKLMVGKELLR